MAFISNVTALSGTTRSVSFTGSDVYTLSLTGVTTFTFTNPPPAGQAASVTIFITQHSSLTYSVNWPTAKWNQGIAHVMSPASSSVDAVTFTTTDGGVTYYGFIASMEMS